MSSAPIRQLRVQDLPAFLQARSSDGTATTPPLLLDVREPWELATARLAPAGVELLHIPMNQLPARLAELDPARTILGLCHHGMRSLQCVAYLQQQGFDDVYNLAGGIDAWSCQVDPAVPRY